MAGMAAGLRAAVEARRRALQPAGAAFWADKLWALTGEPNDLLLLARCHLDAGNPARALRLLQPARELGVDGVLLTAQCLLALGEWGQLGDLLGDGAAARWTRLAREGDAAQHTPEAVAQLCYLHGLAQLKMELPDKAAVSFVEALRLDPLHVEALQKLTDGSLLTASAEAGLLDAIQAAGKTHAGVDTALIRALYGARMAQSQPPVVVSAHVATLVKTYALEANADVLATQASMLLASGNAEACLRTAERALEADGMHAGALLTRIACLHKLKRKNELFLLAHQLVDSATGHQALPWYAVGVYYLLTRQMEKARLYFSRAISYESTMVQAWIGFGHSFALRDEHDSALAAYTTAARLAPRSHLPLMFMGKEYLKLNDLPSAEQYLKQAHSIAPRDAVTLNELGVLCIRQGNYGAARAHLEMAIEVDPANPDLEPTFINLGHALRKLKNYASARDSFERALQLNPLSAETLTALGLLHQLEHRLADAVELYHQALGLDGEYTLATDLLTRALENLFVMPVELAVPAVPPVGPLTSPARSSASAETSAMQLDSSGMSMDVSM